MRRNSLCVLTGLFSAILLACFARIGWGETQPGLSIQSPSGLLMDGASGQIIFENNPERTFPPASLAKMMTLYLAFDALKSGAAKPDQEVVISTRAWKMGGSQMFLNVGDKVKFIELIKGVASVSANDGAVAIAEFLAGSEEAFAQKMNEKASALGLKNTHFVNSNGLPGEGQMTCAMDMALLGFHYVHDYPEALQYHSLPFFEYRGIKQKNWNALLTMDSRVDGLKTGYLSKVGYHVLFSAKQDNLRFIGAVMGAQTSRGRDRDAVKLIEYGFNSFTTITFAKKGDVVAKVPVSRGKIHEVDLLADKSMFVSVRKGTEKKTPLKKEIPSSAAAPIKKGDVLGKLIVEGDGFPKTEVNLVAAVDVPLKSYRVFYMAGAVLIGVIVALAVWKFRPPPKRKW